MIMEKCREGRSILVGLLMDAIGNEVLEWAISRVAEQGDRVVAVHVCRDSDLKNTTTLSLIKVLEDHLAVHESSCNLKQIALVGRVSRGNSIRKVLVREAKLCNAMTVLVGVKKHISLRGSASLAKYCAKNLPPTTAVIAVQNGKIIFERRISYPASSGEKQVTTMERRITGQILTDKEDSRTGRNDERQLDLTDKLKTILTNNNSGCRWFQYDELCASTDKFSPGNLIGKGGSSQVYRGSLADGLQVAIKLSKVPDQEALRDFLLEVDIITKLKHKLIVPLLGFCFGGRTLISVFNYFPVGSLEENLHGKGDKSALSWELRFKVATGIAEALSYLHNDFSKPDFSKPVIHRDVKCSNILLTGDFEPQLSDFGLALWAPTSSINLTQNDVVVGTFGYLAPEYLMYGMISEKIDVFAFGVVLLELLTGRKPIADEISKGEGSLVMWATPLLQRGDLKGDLLDPRLDEDYDRVQMERMILAASLCIMRRPHLRPQMEEILSLLRGDEDIEQRISCNCYAEDDDEAIGSCLSLALLDVGEEAGAASFEHS